MTAGTASPGPAPPRSDELNVVEREHDGVHVLSGFGDLDLAGAVTFCARVDAARDAGNVRLLIDLTHLSFCDTSGLRALTRAAEEFALSAGDVAMVAPTDADVARLFAVTVADERLPLHTSVDDGLASLARA